MNTVYFILQMKELALREWRNLVMWMEIQLTIKKKEEEFYLSQAEDYNPENKFSESSENCSAC